MKLKVLFKGLFLLLVLEGMNENWIDHYVRGQGLKGWVLFIGLGGVLAACGFPRQVLAFLGGYAFGLLKGATVGVMAAGLGCIITFSISRFLARSFVLRKFPRKIERIDKFLENRPFEMTLLIRLLPAGSNVVTNAAAGVSGVRFLPFFLGSLLGYIPQTVIFALAGSGVELNPKWNIILSVILLVISAALGIYLYRKHRKGRSLGQEIDQKLVEETTP